ncbi:hypothetical protein ACV8DN_002890 [Morganella morganii]|uniref:Uncharacterized protein n=1 Tax=Morganella morganii TaxID=582 RepID=A0AAU8ZP70_MORMO|nr:hypothetical protein [Morganella morganii]AWC94471.1 hypothetical protein AM380_12835 [Morganella morganii]
MRIQPIVFLTMLQLTPITGFSNSTATVEDIMIVSKYTGMCGVFSQLSKFQESTKMDNGDEFLERFFNTELSRLNTTPEEFIKNCNKATETYDGYMETFKKMSDSKSK